MGIFQNIFGRQKGKSENTNTNIPWIALTSLEQLDAISTASTAKPQVIFKHSTTCGVSRMVLQMLNGAVDLPTDKIDFYYLDLHTYRPVSNTVARQFGVRHESPQLLVIKNGTVVRHASHGAISGISLNEYS